jgi:hypothetical protein
MRLAFSPSVAAQRFEVKTNAPARKIVVEVLAVTDQ